MALLWVPAEAPLQLKVLAVLHPTGRLLSFREMALGGFGLVTFVTSPTELE